MNRRRFIKSALSALGALPFVGLLSNVKYYANPAEVGYIGSIDLPNGTAFIRLDGGVVVVEV